MNASLSWIKAYVEGLDVSYQEFRDAMTLSGSKVEGFNAFDEDLDRIVIGKVLEVRPHPDADKLVVCQVDVGNGTVQIVTGADNVFEGAKVPTVLDGGRVAGGHDGSMVKGGIKIKAGKLRGVDSAGMMCSIEELGSSGDMFPDAPEDGLYILPEDAPVGEDAVEYLGLHDANYEFEITSNRVDCYSVLGLAREAAATFRKKFVNPKPEIKKTVGDINEHLQIEIKDTGLCRRYSSMMVKNIRIAQSPEWLKKRLRSSGIRPINNVVDITNYVMEEYGQPMHAFDHDAIKGGKIIVQRAKDGDKFTTLDGQERELDKDILMICDAEKPIGIAGIMGGEDSKITDDVKTLVFESACFDGTNNRLSAKRLGMRTDASGKYEKGLDPNNTVPALIRACQLIEELDAGDVVGGMIDIYPEPVTSKQIRFDSDKINTFLGTQIDRDTQLAYLKPLEIEYDEKTEMLTVPTFRQDLLREADIAEEVARFYGYDKIPATLPQTGVNTGGLTEGFIVNEKIRTTLKAAGYSEAMTYSFESPKVFGKLRLDENDEMKKAIRISNPLGEDYSIMRTSLIGGMLTSLSVNYNRRNKKAALFELSNIYLSESIPPEKLPDERMTLCVGFYNKGDFFDLKGAIEQVFKALGITIPRSYDNKRKPAFLHPGRQARVMIKGGREEIGFLGQVHPLVAKKYGIGTDVFLAQLDVKALCELTGFDRKYKPIPKYPAVTRDLSLVMAKEVPAGDIEAVIKKCGGKLLESIELFDVYEGERIGEGERSLAYSISFRAQDKTLEDAQVNPVIDKMIEKLGEIGARLRS